ncbi:KAP family P-loop NTPase fold protein [Tritonibacter mobilis]|uniref:KAP family P-loop NTPase fold protein n=1 Tax=Tritonibacter mobilis TaxID=379347 RepID=UPI001D0DA1DC|nr:P-loop NTPase fold protein [Tritonibacter mobilis]
MGERRRLFTVARGDSLYGDLKTDGLGMALVTNEEPKVAWEGDALGYKEVGETFTTLVKSVKDDTKVISIEAGYGRGKTFFRKHWAKHLSDDEVVIQIDAHLSDHSGDPVLTFIGALVDALPEGADQRRKVAIEKGKQIVGALGRTVGGVLAKQGAGAIVDYLSDEFLENVDLEAAAEEQLEKFGDNLSKAAGSMIAAQITAERVRKKELPAQMNALRDALTEDKPNNRVIVMVDELDRCHPDYAIAFLEAMKLVFAHDGFVFCLFVNDEYLEGLAAHRFGAMKAGERYLDKFIDIRLKLPDTKEVIAGAAEELFKGLKAVKHSLPFGEGDEFTIERAARLAGELAPLSELSMRQIERVKLRVELALRCYPEQPLDYALLVWLAFLDASVFNDENEKGRSAKRGSMASCLPRAELTKRNGKGLAERFSQQLREQVYVDKTPSAKFLERNCLPFFGVDTISEYRQIQDSYSKPHFKKLENISASYRPLHWQVLNALHRYEVASEEGA